MNQTASDVWRLTDGQHTINEIVDLLARAYQVDVHSISDDVGQTVEGFVDAGLIDGR
ncbi:MAG: PqqD family protein [Acidobacteria bacterium]|nr:PqqD family protein [Acidobacteriota bacterium]